MNRGDSPGATAIYESTPTILNTIIAFSVGAPAVYCLDSAPTTAHCCIFGNEGGDDLCGTYYDNLATDPLLCNVYSGDLTPCADSECLAANNEWSEVIGAYGEAGCPDSDSPVKRVTWSVVKTMFRS